MQQAQSPETATPLFRIKDGEDFEIPETGSLGLLALGYVGLMAWRQKKNEAMAQKMSTTPPETYETPH